MYEKNFSEWGTEKLQLEHKNDEDNFFPKVRGIWYVKLGVNIGFEADGKKHFTRPVLILSKVGSLFWVAPLTSKLKNNLFHHTLQSVSFEDIDSSVVMLSQARIIDKKRFISFAQRISIPEHNEIQKKMRKLYFLSL